MQEIGKPLEKMRVTRLDHLSTVAAFCRRIGLMETINRVVPTETDADAGTTVPAMVLDTLSGRSPLYRQADFSKHQDTALLLGRQLADSVCNDTSAGRAMDGCHPRGGSRKTLRRGRLPGLPAIPLGHGQGAFRHYLG